MGQSKSAFLVLSLALLLVACSKGKETKANFVISIGALTSGSAYTGGVLLHVNEVGGSGRKFVFDMSATDNAIIPHGVWDFFILGYDGTVGWQGNTVCGSNIGMKLSSAEQTVEIQVDAADCAQAEFVAIKAAKATEVAGSWDQTNWNQSAWGP